MRGERAVREYLDTPQTGSSPHARGTHHIRARIGHHLRFIPACAGNARSGSFRLVSFPVHPRMRGERVRLALRCMASSGSSPHARGTPSIDAKQTHSRRFIPACAGNAMRCNTLIISPPVHPRMRGERPRRLVVSRRCMRFIPACAGNAYIFHAARAAFTVHPRMRGERQAYQRLNVNAGGSSPHARGTLPGARHFWPSIWFIPACAGNAFPPWWRRACRLVHPRMRGERLREMGLHDTPEGSSPHARGTHFQ